MHTTTTRSLFGLPAVGTVRSIVTAVTVLATGLGCASSSQRVNEGASSGAALGAGVGLLIGMLSGNPDKAVAGLAVGAAVGAGEGAYQGWRQEQDDERTRELVEAIRESKSTAPQQTAADPSTRAREELTRFLGVWSMEGWVQETGQERLTVTAKVNGNVEMNYFVELAYIDVAVPGVDTPIWGTSMLGYEDGQGYNITTRFNTLPDPLRISGGTFAASTRTFTFAAPGTRIVVRFENPDRFTTETFVTANGREQQIESYRFTRT